jgi:thiamine biosynthesis lipoprotein
MRARKDANRSRPAPAPALLVAAWAMAALAAIAAAPPRPPVQPIYRATRDATIAGVACEAIADGHADTAQAGAALDEALAAMDALGSATSAWFSGSELATLNATAGRERVAPTPDLRAAIDSALAIAEETEGAYDPTILPLERAWDIRGAGHVPPPDERLAARALVGWQGVIRQPGGELKFSRDGVGLDLDGTVPGLTLDRGASILRARGILRTMMSLGGTSVAFSKRDAWRVTVAHPQNPGLGVARLPVTAGGISTCEQTDEGFTANGVHFGRLFDPFAGAPIRSQASVTVIAPSATRAQGIAAALLVMGRDRARTFTLARPDLGVLWLEPAGDDVNAWAWNLESVEAISGRLHWRERP